MQTLTSQTRVVPTGVQMFAAIFFLSLIEPSFVQCEGHFVRCTVIGAINGIGKPSSNFGRDSLFSLRANAFEKDINTYNLPRRTILASCSINKK